MLRSRFELLGRQQQYCVVLRLHMYLDVGARSRVLERHQSSAPCWQICLEKYASTSYLEVRFLVP